MDRRDFLVGATACGGTLVADCAASPRTAAPLVLGMTDITVQDALQADFAGTILALRKIGYTHFGNRLRSWNPAVPELPVMERAKILCDAGMQIGAVRLTPRIGRTVPLADEISDAQVLNARIVVMTTAPQFVGSGGRRLTPTLQELNALIRELNEVGGQIKAAGMVFAWHNHDADAVPVEGSQALDRIIDGTDPDKVFFELDLAWAHVGGYDPLDLAKRMGKRLVSLHLKDVRADLGQNSRPRFASPGEGIMDYRTLLPRLRAITDALPAIEVDDAGAEGMAIAQRAYDFVRTTL